MNLEGDTPINIKNKINRKKIYIFDNSHCIEVEFGGNVTECIEKSIHKKCLGDKTCENRVRQIIDDNLESEIVDLTNNSVHTSEMERNLVSEDIRLSKTKLRQKDGLNIFIERLNNFNKACEDNRNFELERLFSELYKLSGYVDWFCEYDNFCKTYIFNKAIFYPKFNLKDYYFQVRREDLKFYKRGSRKVEKQPMAYFRGYPEAFTFSRTKIISNSKLPQIQPEEFDKNLDFEEIPKNYYSFILIEKELVPFYLIVLTDLDNNSDKPDYESFSNREFVTLDQSKKVDVHTNIERVRCIPTNLIINNRRRYKCRVVKSTIPDPGFGKRQKTVRVRCFPTNYKVNNKRKYRCRIKNNFRPRKGGKLHNDKIDLRENSYDVSNHSQNNDIFLYKNTESFEGKNLILNLECKEFSFKSFISDNLTLCGITSTFIAILILNVLLWNSNQGSKRRKVYFCGIIFFILLQIFLVGINL